MKETVGTLFAALLYNIFTAMIVRAVSVILYLPAIYVMVNFVKWVW